MAIILILWVFSLVINLAPLINSDIDGIDFYQNSDIALYTFIYAPAYISGLSVFLVSSYMIDTQNDLADIANTDSLIKLYDRRYFTNNAASLINHTHNTASVIVCDIDNLKTSNDHYGDDAGDQFIMKFADILKKHSPIDSIFIRFGADEFVVLLPMQTRPHSPYLFCMRQ